MMTVMRKMLLVAYRLLKTKETHDPAKVFAQGALDQVDREARAS